MLKYITNNEIETKEIAKNIAKKLNKSDIIILSGDLGSGKTKFVEGILEEFKLQDEISSPTFTIVNEYKNNQMTINHFDVYRLNSIDEFFEIGGEEYFDKGICLIEWGEMLEQIIKRDYLKIEFEKDDKNENIRIINFNIKGTKFNWIKNLI